ncbi:hypothetical protein AB0B30_33720 [Streptomyces narbonensis]|uniref:Secreted protein n=1 Tax=Streptomyces narbonensis TaxID=67333 RepID=A0ABV3CKS5_9ACTN
MRKLATAVVAAGLFFGGMGVAVADSWKSVPRTAATGVALESGAYKWEDPGKNHGAFHLRGRLADRDITDGNNVYLEIRVAGYSWNKFKGIQNRTVPVDALVYDGAARYTTTAQFRVCRDRGAIRPNNCSATKGYKRAIP